MNRIALFLASWALCWAPCQVSHASSLKAQVLSALNARHGSFLKRLKKLPASQVSQLLEQIALDDKRRLHQRVRAMVALRSHKRGVQVYQSLLQRSKPPVGIRRQALRSLSLVKPALAVPFATTLLNHADFTLRAAAVHALARKPSAATLSLLQKRARVERRASLKRLLSTQILRVQQLLKRPTAVRPR